MRLKTTRENTRVESRRPSSLSPTTKKVLITRGGELSVMNNNAIGFVCLWKSKTSSFTMILNLDDEVFSQYYVVVYT